MNIKTWKERITTPLTNLQNLFASMQAEIDELRAALQERDAEIERLTGSELGLNRYLAIVEADLYSTRKQVDAQSKALEQALEALQSLFSFKVDDTRGERCSSAITAIQKVLHG